MSGMVNETDLPNLSKISVTGLSQYVRLRNCERFLYLQLHKDELKQLLKKWDVTIQPLTPLLKESGLDFEKRVAEKLKERGEPIIDLEKEGIESTRSILHSFESPIILLQATLEGEIGAFTFSGIADVIRLERDRQG